LSVPPLTLSHAVGWALKNIMNSILYYFIIPLSVVVVGLFIEYWIVKPIRNSSRGKNDSKASTYKDRKTHLQVRSIRVSKLIAWAVVGTEDENMLISSVSGLLRLLFAMVVWGIFGAVIGVILMLILTGLVILTDNQINGVPEGIKMGATIGAVVGTIFRGVIWPITDVVAGIIQKRRSGTSGKSLDQDSLLIYPYQSPPYNAIEMKYVGDEPIKDLEIWLNYKSKDGTEIQKQIEEFFTRDDHRMIWRQFKANFLEENDVVRFRLVQKSNTKDRKAIVKVAFTGAKTRQKVRYQREFELNL